MHISPLRFHTKESFINFYRKSKALLNACMANCFWIPGHNYNYALMSHINKCTHFKYHKYIPLRPQSAYEMWQTMLDMSGCVSFRSIDLFIRTSGFCQLGCGMESVGNGLRMGWLSQQLSLSAMVNKRALSQSDHLALPVKVQLSGIICVRNAIGQGIYRYRKRYRYPTVSEWIMASANATTKVNWDIKTRLPCITQKCAT